MTILKCVVDGQITALQIWLDLTHNSCLQMLKWKILIFKQSWKSEFIIKIILFLN